MHPATPCPSRGSATSSGALLRAATALVLVLVLAAPSAAAARKRVAVIGFDGPQAAKAEAVVVRVLKDEGYQIVGPTNWKRAQRRVRVRGRGEVALAKTAKRTRVAAVVYGRVHKRGRRLFLSISVHDGKSGILIDTVEVRVKRGKIDRHLDAAVAQDLAPVVRRGEAVAGTAPPPEERDEPAATGRDNERPGGGDLGSGGGDRSDLGSGDVPTTRKEPPAAGGPSKSAFTAGAGMSLWARSMTITPDAAADTYKGQPVPGLRVDGELFPAALFTNNILADFGVGFFVDMVWLSSEMSGGGAKLATTQTRWGVDLRWRWKFLDGPTSPVLKAAFQVSQLKFTIGDRASAPPDLDIPDVSYMSYAPMVGIAIPLGTPRFQLGGTFGFLITSETGAPAQTTSGSSWGIEVGLNFDFYPLPWLLTRAQFGLLRYATSFSPDPSGAATATGMADMYLGGLLTAAYVWR